MCGEIWLPIRGYEDSYLISNFGNIKSLPREVVFMTSNQFGVYLVTRLTRGKLHTNFPHRRGYPYITLYHKGTPKKFSVHRLVAEHFIPNPNNHPEVNHKDGQRHNNHFSNLEWCTSSQNQLHSTKILKRGIGEDHGLSKLTEDDVLKMRKLYSSGLDVESLSVLFSASKSNVRRILNHEAWVHVI